ncbi:hypothetical protein [Sneathiella limimaris]|uniref:hypothetical protein n=1 Tax=Sneathiella limimaris TaxID=1964213 RepID=UPI00146E83BF|nr:hypothetical protein [Sneathiella limimaris]
MSNFDQETVFGKAETIAVIAIFAVVILSLLDFLDAENASVTDYVMAVSSATIAVFTVSQFLLQFRTHRLSRRLFFAKRDEALFEKRMEVYQAVIHCFDCFLREGKPNEDAVRQANFLCRQLEFILDEEQIDYIKEISEQSTDFFINQNLREPLRARAFAGEDLSEIEREQKDSYLRKMQEIRTWFRDQIDQNLPRAKFKNILDMSKF